VALTALALVPAAQAQIPGMPLFTNPRYGTGLRVHADYGQATEAAVAERVIEGGLSLALGPIGLSATVGTLKSNLSTAQTCINNPTLNCSSQHLSAAALAQLRVMGGGHSNMSLSLFGGAATDVNAGDFVDCTQFTGTALTICQQEKANRQTKALTIPVGAAIGLRIPLGVASLNLWGAPRYSLTKFVNCPSSNTLPCDAKIDGVFRWAVGADFPILKILSIRAAFDSGKVGNQTVSFWGLGASIGLGGVR
jgi:hypothetical protein